MGRRPTPGRSCRRRRRGHNRGSGRSRSARRLRDGPLNVANTALAVPRRLAHRSRYGRVEVTSLTEARDPFDPRHREDSCRRHRRPSRSSKHRKRQEACHQPNDNEGLHRPSDTQTGGTRQRPEDSAEHSVGPRGMRREMQARTPIQRPCNGAGNVERHDDCAQGNREHPARHAD